MEATTNLLRGLDFGDIGHKKGKIFRNNKKRIWEITNLLACADSSTITKKPPPAHTKQITILVPRPKKKRTSQFVENHYEIDEVS